MNKLLQALALLRTAGPRDMAALTKTERRDLANQLERFTALARAWDSESPKEGVLSRLRNGERAP